MRGNIWLNAVVFSFRLEQGGVKIELRGVIRNEATSMANHTLLNISCLPLNRIRRLSRNIVGQRHHGLKE